MLFRVIIRKGQKWTNSAFLHLAWCSLHHWNWNRHPLCIWQMCCPHVQFLPTTMALVAFWKNALQWAYNLERHRLAQAQMGEEAEWRELWCFLVAMGKSSQMGHSKWKAESKSCISFRKCRLTYTHGGVIHPHYVTIIFPSHEYTTCSVNPCWIRNDLTASISTNAPHLQMKWNRNLLPHQGNPAVPKIFWANYKIRE